MGRAVPWSDERLFMKFPLLSLVLLSLFPVRSTAAAPADWLIDPTPFKARVKVSADGRELELNNGLIRRVIRLQPNAATVALDNLVNGESLLRGVKSEAIVELDGRRFEVGGLQGQPNYAFLRLEWGLWKVCCHCAPERHADIVCASFLCVCRGRTACGAGVANRAYRIYRKFHWVPRAF